jgi:hypothetical protein
MSSLLGDPLLNDITVLEYVYTPPPDPTRQVYRSQNTYSRDGGLRHSPQQI